MLTFANIYLITVLISLGIRYTVVNVSAKRSVSYGYKFDKSRFKKSFFDNILKMFIPIYNIGVSIKNYLSIYTSERLMDRLMNMDLLSELSTGELVCYRRKPTIRTANKIINNYTKSLKNAKTIVYNDKYLVYYEILNIKKNEGYLDELDFINVLRIIGGQDVEIRKSFFRSKKYTNPKVMTYNSDIKKAIFAKNEEEITNKHKEYLSKYNYDKPELELNDQDIISTSKTQKQDLEKVRQSLINSKYMNSNTDNKVISKMKK